MSDLQVRSAESCLESNFRLNRSVFDRFSDFKRLTSNSLSLCQTDQGDLQTDRCHLWLDEHRHGLLCWYDRLGAKGKPFESLGFLELEMNYDSPKYELKVLKLIPLSPALSQGRHFTSRCSDGPSLCDLPARYYLSVLKRDGE